MQYMANKHENYEILNLIGYGLAKFNDGFIREFGVSTKTAFYRYCVDCGVATTTGTISNRMDLFDPFFDNGRRGWWQKGDAYIHRKRVIDSLFGSLDVKSYTQVIKSQLICHFDVKPHEFERENPIQQSRYRQLQKTGLEAELYFQENYESIAIFKDGVIEDARLYGDGYDFQIDVNDMYYLAEVKGVRSQKGNIRLTQKEWGKAKMYENDYVLTVISNLTGNPKISTIPNPIKELEFTKNSISQEQTFFNTNRIIW